MTTKPRPYARLISNAIGTDDLATLDLVEHLMRSDHGTLDGLTPDQFTAAARQALADTHNLANVGILTGYCAAFEMLVPALDTLSAALRNFGATCHGLVEPLLALQRFVETPITVEDLAAELDVTVQDITALVDQLIVIDGAEVVIDGETAKHNGSDRVVGTQTTLTAQAASSIREQLCDERAEL